MCVREESCSAKASSPLTASAPSAAAETRSEKSSEARTPVYPWSASQLASGNRTLSLQFLDAAGNDQFDFTLKGLQQQFSILSQADAAGHGEVIGAVAGAKVHAREFLEVMVPAAIDARDDGRLRPRRIPRERTRVHRTTHVVPFASLSS